MKNKNRFISYGLLVMLVLMLGLTGCGGEAQKNGEKPQVKEIPAGTVDPNATIVVGMQASILTLDPANHRDRYTETVIRNIFDGLVTRTAEGKIVPEIAESWEVVEPTVWEFNIRQGITFHNGDPLTADDVKFTFDRILNEGQIDGQSSPRKGLLGPVQSVEKVNDYKVRFKLESPWPILLQMLPHQQIVPKKYVEEVGSAAFTAKPIGAGPFKLVEGKLDERIVLERFDGYYGGSPDLPPVGPAQAKTVIFEVIPETSTRMAALLSGEAQIVQAVPVDMVSQLEQDDTVEVKMVDGTKVYMFQLNTKKAPLNNVKVRQALNHAMNMDLIVEKILGGYATRLAGPLLSTGFAVDKELKPYAYDLKLAKGLLKEAGYPDGFSVVIDTINDDKPVAEAVAAQLREVGVDATVRIWDWGVLKPLLEKGERSIVLMSWGNSTQDPFDILNPTLNGVGERGNFSFYDNAQVKDLLDRAGSSIDEQERLNLYKQAQQIIYTDAPWIFGFSKKEIEVSVKGIVNWQPSMDGRINMHDVGLIAK